MLSSSFTYFSLLIGFGFLTLTSCDSVLASTDTKPVASPLTRHPYLQLATSDSIHVVWRQRTEAVPSVRYGTAPTILPHKASGPKAVTIRSLEKDNATSPDAKPLHTAPENTRQYEVKISGLTPDTVYYYAVYDGETRLTPASEAYSFRTLPLSGAERPAWIWVAGDGGTGGKFQAAVHDSMVKFTRQKKVSLDLFLHVGDMAYNSGLDPEFQGRFFEMYQDTLRHTVCWPAMGNHENATSKGSTGVGPYYDAFITPTKAEAGGVPSGREAYYSFDFGNIHFIVLDSCGETMTRSRNLSPLGDSMMEWLKADLERNKSQWLIAYWHHPPYSKGSHDTDTQADYESIVMRETYVPLLESAGVDLILSGHSHIYERSMLIDGAHQTPSTAHDVVIDDGDGDPRGDGAYKKSAGMRSREGFVAVVAGNAGTSLRRKGTHPLMKRIILEHGSVLIHVGGDTLRALMLNKDGKVSDVFALEKKGIVPTRPKIADPKPPPPMPQRNFIHADGREVPAGSTQLKGSPSSLTPDPKVDPPPSSDTKK